MRQQARRLCDPEGPFMGNVTKETHWERLFRVIDSWGDMKGQSMRETLELEALFLTKERQHRVWVGLLFFFLTLSFCPGTQP